MKLNLNEKGLRTECDFINPSRFADDIMLLESLFQELKEMFQKFNKENKFVGLKLILSNEKKA